MDYNMRWNYEAVIEAQEDVIKKQRWELARERAKVILQSVLIKVLTEELSKTEGNTFTMYAERN